MTYDEIEQIFKDAEHEATLHRLRKAVREEAGELHVNQPEYSKGGAILEAAARDYYATDISDWCHATPGSGLSPNGVLSHRARYVNSWAFAKILLEIQSRPDEPGFIQEAPVDPDRMVKLCTANAELATRVLELSGIVVETAAAVTNESAIADRHMQFLEKISHQLDLASIHVVDIPTDKPLDILGRVELMARELKELRKHG